MNQEELRKLMECYRSGAPDPEFVGLPGAAEEPGVRRELEAIQAWDRQIERALRDVPVPEDLEARLRAALSIRPVNGSSVELVQPGSQVRTEVGSSAVRRRWLLRAAAMLTMAGLLTAVVYIVFPPDRLTLTSADALARQWKKTLNEESWNRITTRAQLPHLTWLRFEPSFWQDFPAPGYGDAKAYLGYAPTDHSPAYLLVVRTRQGKSLPDVPPTKPNSTTESLSVGIWKSGGHLYVLMVSGPASNYQQLLKSQTIAALERSARQEQDKKIG